MRVFIEIGTICLFYSILLNNGVAYFSDVW